MRDSTKANSISGDELPGSSAALMAEISVAKSAVPFLVTIRAGQRCVSTDSGVRCGCAGNLALETSLSKLAPIAALKSRGTTSFCSSTDLVEQNWVRFAQKCIRHFVVGKRTPL